jgi:hypothetical protein
MRHSKNLFSKFLILSSVLLFSCSVPDGACESKTVLSGAGYNLYSCIDKNEDYCKNCSTDDCFFHEDKSCESLGYTYSNSINPDLKKASQDGRSPGANGAFANDSSRGGDCSGSYKGPDFDIQIDSQCKNAFAARCAGQDAVADASCKIYKSYQANDSSIPDCPYCN